jgi:hypothetical protein
VKESVLDVIEEALANKFNWRVEALLLESLLELL